LLELHIDKAAIDAAFKEMTGGLSDLDRDSLGKTAAKMAVLVKTPERIRRVCEDIVQHFQSKVEPNGFKGQIVTIDRESCLLYKAELDRLLPPEASAVVMTVNANEPERRAFAHSRDEEERLLDRFRDARDPLQLLIVTSKLLTGFDAPILQAMYLDKPLRDHTLLQAICRVNRTYSEQKTHGLIVDYLGIFDDVAKALEFDDKSMAAVVSNIQELKDRLAGGHAEVSGLLCRRGSHGRRLRRPDRCAAMSAQQHGARQLRRRVQRDWAGYGKRFRLTLSWANTRRTTSGCRRSISRCSLPAVTAG
jgi:type I restriction enzyme R subunit